MERKGSIVRDRKESGKQITYRDSHSESDKGWKGIGSPIETRILNLIRHLPAPVSNEKDVKIV